MAYHTLMRYIPTIVLVMIVAWAVVPTYANLIISTEDSKDCTVENSIKEMLAKLEAVMTPKGFCSNESDSPKLCIDMTSTQSVLTQLCDQLAALDSKVSGLTTKVNVLTAPPNHNSVTDYTNKPFTQITILKEEIKQLKQSAVFYARHTDKIGNHTHERIVSYNATVNTGNYFDTTSGIFYAPFEGIYHFSLRYQKAPEISLEACLVVDSDIIATTSEEQQPNIDIFTPLTHGQEVWVDSTSNNSPTDSDVTFTFSGYLVH